MWGIWSYVVKKLENLQKITELRRATKDLLHAAVFKHCPTAGMRNGDEASPRINLAGKVCSENAQNSWTAWWILLKFCMLLYYYLDWELPRIPSK